MAELKRTTTPPTERVVYTLFLSRKELMMIIEGTRDGWYRKAVEAIKSRHEPRSEKSDSKHKAEDE